MTGALTYCNRGSAAGSREPAMLSVIGGKDDQMTMQVEEIPKVRTYVMRDGGAGFSRVSLAPGEKFTARILATAWSRSIATAIASPAR